MNSRKDDRFEIERQAIRAAADTAGVPPSTFEGKMVRAILTVLLADDNRDRMAGLLKLVPYEHVREAEQRGNREGRSYGRVEIINELALALDNAQDDEQEGIAKALAIAQRKHQGG